MEPGSRKIQGDVNYDGENFKFQASTGLKALISSFDTVGWESANPNRLWGSYNLLNEMLLLEVAFDSRDTTGAFWTSDVTGAWFTTDGVFYAPVVDMTNIWRPAGDGFNDAFTANDHGNFLVGNINLENLSFGLMVRNLFYNPTYTHGNAAYPKYRGKDTAKTGDPTTGRDYAEDAVMPKAVDTGDGGALLVEDVLKKMIFGVKFNMQPIEFAAQIMMEDYGVYFGGKVFFGAVTVGASFMGIMAPTNYDGSATNETLVKLGGSVAYDADAFGAGLGAWYGIEDDKDNDRTWSQIGIEPYFFYNVIPTHLQFRADVGFYFNNAYAYKGTDKINDLSDVIWGLQPQLFWNFKGTGAGSYWGFDTDRKVQNA